MLLLLNTCVKNKIVTNYLCKILFNWTKKGIIQLTWPLWKH